MKSSQKDSVVGVSYRIPARVREWLNTESAMQERSANWLVTKILSDAYQQSRKQQGAQA